MRVRWASGLALLLLVLPACEGNEPRGAYGGQVPKEQLEDNGKRFTGEARLKGTVKAIDEAGGELNFLVAPAKAKGQSPEAKKPSSPNPSESVQFAGTMLVLHGTPHQLQSLSVGQETTLPTVQYENEVWLAPGFHRQQKVKGSLENQAGNGRKLLHGRIHSLQARKGIVVVETRGGQTETIRAHPADLLGLQSDGFVNVLYEDVHGTRWALAVHSTMEAGEQAWPGSEGGKPVDGGVSDLPRQATSPKDGGAPTPQDGGAAGSRDGGAGDGG